VGAIGALEAVASTAWAVELVRVMWRPARAVEFQASGVGGSASIGAGLGATAYATRLSLGLIDGSEMSPPDWSI
jgi:hypothetical protein